MSPREKRSGSSNEQTRNTLAQEKKKRIDLDQEKRKHSNAIVPRREKNRGALQKEKKHVFAVGEESYGVRKKRARRGKNARLLSQKKGGRAGGATAGRGQKGHLPQERKKDLKSASLIWGSPRDRGEKRVGQPIPSAEKQTTREMAFEKKPAHRPIIGEDPLVQEESLRSIQEKKSTEEA